MERTINRPSLAFALVSSLALFASCAGSSGPGAGFDINFPDNRASNIGAIASQIATRPTPSVDNVVVVAAPAPARGISVFSLPDGQRLWQITSRIDSRPVVTSGLVVAHSDGQVFAWDARTGRERWHVADHGFSLIGAGGDDQFVALSLGPGSINQRRGVFLVVDARSGSIRYEKSVEQALGVPTVAGGYAFVPWNGQYLTIIDAAGGQERARIRSGDDLFGRALREGNAVYFGSRALYRLSEASGRGQRSGAETYSLPREDLPGNPPLMNDGYVAAMCGVNARERVAVISRPDPTQSGAHLLDDTVYVLFYRTVFSLDARNGNVHWAYVHGTDVAGGLPVRNGFVLVGEHGEAVLLDGTHGNPVHTARLGTAAAQAVISLPIDYAPPRANDEPPMTAAASLVAAAGGTDTRLLPARLFAARALATVPGDEATRGLLDIAGRRSYPQELRAAAGESLSRRTDGIEAMLAALSTHADYLRQTQGPPVGFIARALSNAHDRRGIAPLIAHLRDPETPASELPPVLAALRDFADPSAVPALLDFVRLYHADEGIVPAVGEGEGINDRSLGDQQAINSAIELAIDAIAHTGGPPERRWLQAMLDDANTLDVLRPILQRALGSGAQGSSGPPSGSSGAATAQNGNAPSGGSETSAPVVDDPNIPPTHLTPEMIADGFGPVRDQLLHCMEGMTSRPAQVRLTFRYDSEGHVSNVMVMPQSLTRCMAPIAQSVELRHSQTPRDIGNYYLIGGPL